MLSALITILRQSVGCLLGRSQLGTLLVITLTMSSAPNWVRSTPAAAATARARPAVVRGAAGVEFIDENGGGAGVRLRKG
jgi:hypothetical protein